VVGDGRHWEGGEERSRSTVLGLLGLGLLGLRERERAGRGTVSVGGPVVLVGGARSVGHLVGGGRSVGRWRCTVERGRFGKWPELVGGKEQWPANCSGRRTSVVVGGGDGVSF
jgi:hypothetical protein